MKPNFALNITDADLTLLHRTPRGWLEIGSAAFDSPDLEEALGYLRSSALGLSPQGFTTKLVLPPSQVLYTEVEAPGPDKPAREAQIRAALEGKTPYDIDDLVFDWQGTGPMVRVAVVARETLDEAEGFAATHRLNPVSFVTIPADGQFKGEPWFGPTALAPTVLPDGAKVTRDQDPIKLLPRNGKTDAEAAPGPQTQAQTEAQAERQAEAERMTEAVRAAQAETQAEAEHEARRLAETARDAQREAEVERAVQDAARTKLEAARAEMELRAQALAQAEAKRLVEEAEKLKTSMQEQEKARTARLEAERMRAASGADAAPKANAGTPAAKPATTAPGNVADPAIKDGPQQDEPDQDGPEQGGPDQGGPDQGGPEQGGPDQDEEIPAKTAAKAAAAAVTPTFSSRRKPDGNAPKLGPTESESPSADPAKPAVSPADSAPPVSAPPVPTPPVSAPPVPTPPVSAPPVSAPPVSAPPVSEPPVSPPVAYPAPATPPPVSADAEPAAAPAKSTPLAPQPPAPQLTALNPALAQSAAPAPVVNLHPAAPSNDPTNPTGPVAPTVTALRPKDAGATLADAPAPNMTPKPLNGTATFQKGAKPGVAKPQAPRLDTAMVTASRIPRPKAAAQVQGAKVPSRAAALSRFKALTSGSKPGAADPGGADGSMGKMGQKLAQRRGKPRFLGLILTLVLLALLAGVAAWSSLYLSRNTTAPEGIQQAETDVPDTATAPQDVVASIPDTASAPQMIPEAVAETETPPSAGPGPDVSSDSGAGQAPAGFVAPPADGPQDEINLAQIDGTPPAFEAVTMTRPQTRPDGAPDAAMPPPPFGTQYQFDANGQIMATANGVVMPDGYWLIAARPPVVPPQRPAAIAAADTPPQTEATATPPPTADSTAGPMAGVAAASTAGIGQEGGAGPSSAFTQDATVEDRRPRNRPAALDASPAPSTGPNTGPDDDAALREAADPANQSVAQMASTRPRARPQTVVMAATQAREDAQAASLAASAAAAARAAVQDASLSVALSPRPAARPRDFSNAVAPAVSAATRETSRRQPVAEPQRTTALEPEEEDEPEAKASAPRIPTRANVASQATFKNAINLSKTNLIGVYGTDSRRYALIRSSRGKYSKIRVGDRLDGGTVAAITRSEVRYQKGGRMYALAMPNG